MDRAKAKVEIRIITNGPDIHFVSISEKECYFSSVVGTKNPRNGIFWLVDNARPTNGGWLAVFELESLEILSEHGGLS